MKILHTADWHIGKKLHKYELAEDFDLFITWLCQTMEEEQVEVLLVSGDVFDLANPSSEARAQYYRALIKLRQLNCKLIITGGNHDSPAMLNAPKEILSELDITVIGGLPGNLVETIVPLKNAASQTELVVAALPFLRDADLRHASQGISYEERLEAIRQGIQQKFEAAAELCAELYPNITALAMGHLFAAGIETSESERDIQIGNQAAFSASQFGDYFKYIALGHIHKPQQVSAPVPTFYSGSPLPLSFSERKDEKRVLLLDTQDLTQPKSIPVPAFRKLIRISGSVEKLREKLDQLHEQTTLDSLIEVDLVEENYDAVKMYELDQLITQFEKPGFVIVKHRAKFQNRLQGSASLYEPDQVLEDVKPKEVFSKLLETHEYEAETQQEILSAFDELLEQNQTEQ